MTKEMIKAFTFRVSQASGTELVVIMYDIILADLKEAEDSGTENIEEMRAAVRHSLEFVGELMRTLDYRYGIAVNLLQLYGYCQKLLVRLSISRTPDISELKTVQEIISALREAYAAISSEDRTGAVMQNTQQIYAGLTYGRSSLNETDINPNQVKRGFLA